MKIFRISLLIIFFLVLQANLLKAKSLKLIVQSGVDTTDSQIKQVVDLWRNYLASNPDSLYNNPYWSSKEKEEYKGFDFLRTGFLGDAIYKGFTPLLLSVSPKNNGYYEIKTAFISFYYKQELCVANVYAKKENGRYKLFNALPINTKSWLTKNVGSITYHYSRHYKFNMVNAKRMVAFADSLRMLYNLKPVHADFYIGKSLDELMKLDGLEFYMGMGNAFKVSGFTDQENNIIFSGGGGEYFPHEVVHIYLNPLFKNSNWILQVGLADLYGGSMGHSLGWHIKRLNNYLIVHPEINLDSLYKFWYMDNYTNPREVIGGFLCELAYKKGGIKELKKLLSFGSSENDLYKAIENVFGVKRKNFNFFIREKMKEYSK